MHWRSFIGGSAATLLALAGLSRDKPLAAFNWCDEDRSNRGLRVGHARPAAAAAAAARFNAVRRSCQTLTQALSTLLKPQVVITGSSRELGFSLARQFVSLGDAVVISGRTPATLAAATAALRSEFPGCRVLGVQADASKASDVERLADAAAAELGGIVSGQRCIVPARLPLLA